MSIPSSSSLDARDCTNYQELLSSNPEPPVYSPGLLRLPFPFVLALLESETVLDRLHDLVKLLLFFQFLLLIHRSDVTDWRARGYGAWSLTLRFVMPVHLLNLVLLQVGLRRRQKTLSSGFHGIGHLPHFFDDLLISPLDNMDGVGDCMENVREFAYVMLVVLTAYLEKRTVDLRIEKLIERDPKTPLTFARRCQGPWKQ